MSRPNRFYMGEPVPRIEDARLLTGRGCYVDDFAAPDALHAVVVRSQFAHGRIGAIDAAGALALPGVVAIFTSDDIDGPVPCIPFRNPAIAQALPFRQPVIARHKVRHVGEPIAVVLAETRAIAEDAADLVMVEIEPLPPVAGVDAGRGGTVCLFEDQGTNAAIRYVAERGDAEAAFSKAAYRRRETFRTQRHSASPMETRGLVARWDPERGHLEVHGAAKVPFFNRRVLAEMLGLDEDRIDLIELDVGGAFGVRGEFYPEDFLIPFAALRLGRPVRWQEDRHEHMMAANHSRELSFDIEIACERDGKILALRGRVTCDQGAYVGTTGGILASRSAQFLPGPYDIPAVSLEVEGIVTNKTPAGSYRGPGRFESSFARERLIDMAARDLGIDPAEMRRRNFIASGAFPYSLGQLVPYEGEAVLENGAYGLVLERCLKEIGWDEKQHLRGRMVDGRLHGLGLGSFVDSSGAGPRENARIRLQQDGSIALFVGSSALGQGIETAFSQICADALGVPMETIRVFHGSTTLLGEGFGSFHSRSMVMGGNAVMDAAANFIEAARIKAAEAFGRPVEEITYAAGVLSPSAPGHAPLALADLAGLAGPPVEAEGTFGTKVKPFGAGTHAAHVAVDPRTGAVEVVDYVAVEDVGRMINPMLVHGQKVGAIVQGLGGVFLEEYLYDKHAQLLTGSFADYLLPTATDFPHIRVVTLDETRTSRNPLGLRGAGEDAIAPVAGVIGNAVADALSSLGVVPTALPLTPHAVWQLIKAASASDALVRAGA